MKSVTESMSCCKRLWTEANTWIIHTAIGFLAFELRKRELKVTVLFNFFKPTCNCGMIDVSLLNKDAGREPKVSSYTEQKQNL